MKIKKILVSQPKPSSEKSPYYDIAEKYGINIVFRPFIKVEGLTSKEFRQQKISIPEYTAVIFTARTAIDHFFRLCEELRVTIPETMKYFCTTEAIALYLQKYIIYRKRKIFFGNSGKLDDLAGRQEPLRGELLADLLRRVERALAGISHSTRPEDIPWRNELEQVRTGLIEMQKELEA